MPGRRSTDLDAVIGARIRTARRAAGIKQRELSATLGISAQMLSKYEMGTSRIAASALARLADVLKLSIAGFFEPPAADRGEIA